MPKLGRGRILIWEGGSLRGARRECFEPPAEPDARVREILADSAHFSRTFRRMFGTAAAALDVT